MTHTFSLGSKLAALDIGDVVFLPDPKRTLDRNIITLRTRSPKIEGRLFATERKQYIEGDALLPILKVTRVK